VAVKFILGMAKGRTTFRTDTGRVGAGKRVSSELDLLRLVYAAAVLEAQGHHVGAYFAVLRSADGESTRADMEQWLAKYGAARKVEIIERQLTRAESKKLRAEKQGNAAAARGQGAGARAKYAQRLAEDFLDDEVRRRLGAHDLVEGSAAGVPPPLAVRWDAFYVRRGRG
jgi:hypothetical protein